MASYGAFKDFTNLTAALTLLWRRQFVETSAVASLFNVGTSGRASERTKGMGSMGLVPEKSGSELKRKEIDPLETKEYIHKEFSDYISIPMTLIEDSEMGLISDILGEYSMTYNRTWVYHMSSVFQNAFSGTGHVAADGKALCATGRSSGKKAMTNKGTSALSQASVAETRRLMMQFKDENGLVLMVKPDTLLVGTDLMDTGMVIVGTDRETGSNNNDVNTVRGLNLIVDPLLSGNDWFLIDSTLAKRHLRWWWRIRPTASGGFAVHPASEFDAEVRTRGRMRYSFGFDDTPWIFGHEVA